MHNATTKQRWAALRRRLGIFTGGPRWVRDRRERLARERGAALRAERRTVPAYIAPALSWPLGITPAEAFAAPAAGPAASQLVLDPTEVDPDTVHAGSMSMQNTTSSSAPTVASGGATDPGDTRSLELTEQDDPAALWDRPTLAAGPPPAERRPWRVGVIAAAIVLLLGGALLALRGSKPAASALETRAAPAPAPAAIPDERPRAAVAAVAPSAPEQPAAPAEVEVRRGDTLWHLSGQHLGDPLLWPRMHQANRAVVADPDLIFPGQRLGIPRSPVAR